MSDGAFERACVAEFKTGKIIAHDLEANGICEMSVRVAGHTVTVTWYGGLLIFSTRSLEVDGKSYPVSVPAITRAAKNRAKTLAYERLKELDAALSEEPK
jgi:hypothetical protein